MQINMISISLPAVLTSTYSGRRRYGAAVAQKSCVCFRRILVSNGGNLKNERESAVEISCF
jgi:hypothetical protein